MAGRGLRLMRSNGAGEAALWCRAGGCVCGWRLRARRRPANLLPPYAAVARPYAPGAYDRREPPGYVSAAAVADPGAALLARASSTEAGFPLLAKLTTKE
ncbi:heavy metal-associated isoprenylated plant protein 26-like [Panicum miliaceum]|uniref:Heavy metal-associated isoprenylated plant protein 26-like n=1 Tax=Panicum miliaceum TaxID=4540 RepID=A0A3L6T2R9_PANMI|nr:heavy metal-associated isoprenylated plant protein 26-like [Panicum miliaceum]